MIPSDAGVLKILSFSPHHSTMPLDPGKYAAAAEKGWSGLERALRDSMIKDGYLKPEDVRELEGGTRVLECADEFSRQFTETRLGLALNVGEKGRIIVKRCMPDTPAASRRIPPGCFVKAINGQITEHMGLKQVQDMIQQAERPVTIEFSQSATSRDLALSTRQEAEKQVELQEAADARETAAIKAAQQAAAAQAAENLAELESQQTFSCTWTESRIGLVLGDGGGPERRKGRTFVKKTMPNSPAWLSGIPTHVIIVAINGKSTQFRRFKEVRLTA